MPEPQTLLRRHAQNVLREALSHMPIVVLTGARQTGKSTLADMTAPKDAASFTLDDPTTLAACQDDPLGFLRAHSGRLLVIDEVQRAPELIIPLKMLADETKQRPGQYLLTGSVDMFSHGTSPDTLAGRMELLQIHPLSLGERAGRTTPEDWVHWLRSKPAIASYQVTKDDADLTSLVVQGGFPALHTRSPRARSRWLTSYYTALSDHHAASDVRLRSPERIKAFVKYLAAHPACEVNWQNTGKELGIPASTMPSVAQSAERLFLTNSTSAWTPAVTHSAVHKTKMAVTDTGLAAHLAGFSANQNALVGRREYYGALLEQCVGEELRKQSTWSEELFSIKHFRDKHGLEIDVIIEMQDGSIIPIEVKATASPTSHHWSNVETFRTKYRDRVDIGVVLHTGTACHVIDSWLYVLPIASLWQHPPT